MSLLNKIRKEFKKVDDSQKASEMRRYMKSEMPYRGVQTPIRRKICQEMFKNHQVDDQ